MPHSEILLSLITLSGILALAWMTPGPNMLAVIDASVRGGWTAGVSTGLGISTGNVVWSIVAIAGSDLLFESFPQAIVTIQVLGCGYLAYLGLRSLKSAIEPRTKTSARTLPKGHRSYYVTGLFVIFTNPKSILFFGSIFTALIPPHAAVLWKTMAVLLAGIIPALGHTFTTTVLSRPAMVKKYFGLQRQISVVFAASFFLVAIQLIVDILGF